MVDLCRRSLVLGVASTAAAVISVAPATHSDGGDVTGAVTIDGKTVRFGEFECRYIWGDDGMEERAVVIMDGKIQVQHIASYASSWSGNIDRRRTGVVLVGPKEWVRVPVLGRVIKESQA